VTLTVHAIYENGALKLAEPLPLGEHQPVRITIETSLTTPAHETRHVAPPPGCEQLGPLPDEAERIVRRSYGLLAWTGDIESLRYLAEDSDLDPQESA
jgi:hypothetical protein